MTADPNLNQTIKDYIDKHMDEKVKKIQIDYLKENFLTRGEFLDAMNRMDKRFESLQTQMDKRFESIDKRFVALQTQMNKQFEVLQNQIDKRFETLQNQIDKRFANVFERFDQITLSVFDSFEGMAYSIINSIFRKKEITLELKRNQHFPDNENKVFPDSTDVEIDFLHLNPNIIVEVSTKIFDLEKIRTFTRKIEFIESWYKKSFEHRYFITFYIDHIIEHEAKNIAKKFNIQLIKPKKRKYFL